MGQSTEPVEQPFILTKWQGLNNIGDFSNYGVPLSGNTGDLWAVPTDMRLPTMTLALGHDRAVSGMAPEELPALPSAMCLGL